MEEKNIKTGRSTINVEAVDNGFIIINGKSKRVALDETDLREYFSDIFTNLSKEIIKGCKAHFEIISNIETSKSL